MKNINFTTQFELNNVYHSDCLLGTRNLLDESVDLIYLDPPFFTQRKQQLSNREGKVYEFDDTWDSWDQYLNFLLIRFQEFKRILKPTGNIFVHCDRTASHKIRLLLEEVFGVDNFRAEIIWKYRRWSNAKKGLLESHQNIYHFSKSKQYQFNVIYTPYSPTTNVDQILQNRQRNSAGKSEYARDVQGQVIVNHDKKGVPLADVWEIPYLNPKAKERVGYPTQKPLALLEQIIKIASQPGDVVLDPFMGSGTTLVAAKLLDRQYLGFDCNEQAVALAQQRLQELVPVSSPLLSKGIEAYDNKSAEHKAILSQFACVPVQRNNGLDAITIPSNGQQAMAIKIQPSGVDLATCVRLAFNTMASKKLNHLLLIQTSPDTSLTTDLFMQQYDLSRVTIIKSLDYQIQSSLEL